MKPPSPQWHQHIHPARCIGRCDGWRRALPRSSSKTENKKKYNYKINIKILSSSPISKQSNKNSTNKHKLHNAAAAYILGLEGINICFNAEEDVFFSLHFNDLYYF